MASCQDIRRGTLIYTGTRLERSQRPVFSPKGLPYGRGSSFTCQMSGQMLQPYYSTQASKVVGSGITSRVTRKLKFSNEEPPAKWAKLRNKQPGSSGDQSLTSSSHSTLPLGKRPNEQQLV